MEPILKVSQLNRYVKSRLEADPRLREVYVSGEIGTISVNGRSGHIYFTLREAGASVRAVMFAQNAGYLRFEPQSGLAVIARGAVTLYERDGAYQLIVSELMLDGGSPLGFAFEKQKRLLEQKGYFDEGKKRPIPRNPSTVGIVTSESGAALHDIISVIERRNPAVRLILAPAAVQGREAPQSIAEAVRLLNLDRRCEVIIVGRGGGSAEDLWAFNEEETVRAVSESAVPVISAVGHETDVTLCDLAADLRAATPTAAAQLAVYERERLLEQLARIKGGLDCCINDLIASKERELFARREAKPLKNPGFFIDKNRQILNNLISLMNNHSLRITAVREEELARRAALLESVSPLRVLARGYCIASAGGKTVSRSDELDEGDIVDLRLHRGSVKTRVIEKD